MADQLTNYQYLYLHGFASSPQSRKAVYLARQYQRLGINLNIIDFNQPDFDNLTLTRQINQVQAVLQQQPAQEFVLVGSSFGGLTAHWVAHQSPHRIKALILLAPALNFRNHWLTKVPPEALTQWQNQGYLPIYHYGEKKDLLLNYSFWQDMLKYDEAQVSHNIATLIFHGIGDDIIPIAVSRQYAQNKRHVTLTELNSDHTLNDHHHVIYQDTIDWLRLQTNSNR